MGQQVELGSRDAPTPYHAGPAQPMHRQLRAQPPAMGSGLLQVDDSQDPTP